nr:DUF2508 family protein [uncultured Tyzzerella sp.]
MENLLPLKKEKNLLKSTNHLDSEATEILYFLQDTKSKLEYAELCLNFTCDDTLIDSIIYEIMSLQKKYDYFLKLSKKKGIVINFPQILQKFPAS